MSDIMVPKLLIIGGSGLVGSTLIKYALPNFSITATFNKNEIISDDIFLRKIDLLENRNDVIDIIKKWKPDITVNTVALSNVDLCETDPNLATVLHVDVTKEIANACNEINSKLIHFSTEWVFDGKLNHKYDEKDIPNPINHYGLTRFQAENIVLSASPKNTVLRTAVIYGWHKKSRFTNWIVETLREGKVVDPFADQFNTPTLVDDLIHSILLIIEKQAFGLYHAVGKTCLSRYEFALLLADKFGLDKNLIKPVTSQEKKQIAPRPPRSCLDAQKLEKKIGYSFSSIEEGVSFIYDKSVQK